MEFERLEGERLHRLKQPLLLGRVDQRRLIAKAGREHEAPLFEEVGLNLGHLAQRTQRWTIWSRVSRSHV
jgi:hypothetical protein